MAHIVYIHINSHEVIPNLGMNFDSRYEVRAIMQPLRDYELHQTFFKLNIARCNGLKEGFYGDHIQGLTAIVGNNGAGKTSALRFLLNAVVSGSGHDISGFVVMEDEDHQLFVYHSEDVRIEIEAPNINVQQSGGWPEKETFVYSGHCNVLTSAEDIMSTEWQGMVNATEGYLLSADLQHYGRETATNGFFYLRDYANAFDAQNQWRICNFLSNYDGILTTQLQLPTHVLVLPNKAGQWSLKHRINAENRIEFDDLRKPDDWTCREFRLSEMVYYNIINYISDGLGKREDWQLYLDVWQKMIAEQYQGNVVSLYRQFVDSLHLSQYNESRVWLEYIHEVIQNVSVHCQFEEGSLLHYFYFHTDDDSMKTFVRWLQANPIFIASRYFDLRYAHHYDGNTILSSGEKAMLDMYSRIYDTLIHKHQHDSNYIWPTLFVFDEAEIGFHPNWQRQYVNNITRFMEEMARDASELNRRYNHHSPDFRYQIIITSHSPIILSDVPKECAIMLRRGDDGVTRNMTQTRPQTFGTNIFELYRDSFFLDGGLVGEFAQEYIHHLSDDIDRLQNPDDETVNNIREQINLIGDRNIRMYLLEQLEPYMGQQVLIDEYQQRISYYQEQIDQLQHGHD